MMWQVSNRIESKLVQVAKEKAWQVGSSRHAACIVYRNRILSVGWNKQKTHPLAAKYQPHPQKIYLHAEMDAIIKHINRYGNNLIQDCTLFVLRISNTDKIADSKPCVGCQRLINAVGISQVIHT